MTAHLIICMYWNFKIEEQRIINNDNTIQLSNINKKKEKKMMKNKQGIINLCDNIKGTLIDVMKISVGRIEKNKNYI